MDGGQRRAGARLPEKSVANDMQAGVGMQWFMEKDGKPEGPLSDVTIRDMAGKGLLVAETRVWKAGMSAWVRAADVPGLLAPPVLPQTDPAPPTSRPDAYHSAAGAIEGSGKAVPDYRIPVLARVWPRYWARMLDLIIGALLAGAVLGVVAPQLFESKMFTEPGGEFLLNMIFVPIALVVDAILGGLFGNTPGKALAGLRVRTLRSERPTLGDFITRNLRLYFSGLGMGIPLVSLFTMVKSYNTVKESGVVSWDATTDTRVYAVDDARWRTWAAAILMFVLLVGASALGTL